MSAEFYLGEERLANRQGTRWRGKLDVPERCHPLVRTFFDAANEQQTTMHEIAVRAGFCRDTLSSWRGQHNPTIANFEAALNVLDLELCIKPRMVPK